MSKPIILELDPDELHFLANWATAYLAYQPLEPEARSRARRETDLALQLLKANARFMTAALTGEDARP